MPVPKRKVSKSRRDSRQANKGIQPQTVGSCSNCNEPILPHRACASCGFYKGKKVIATKLERTVKRAETRAAQQAKKAESTGNDQSA